MIACLAEIRFVVCGVGGGGMRGVVGERVGGGGGWVRGLAKRERHALVCVERCLRPILLSAYVDRARPI